MKSTENLKYEAARRQVKKIRGFYIHLLVYVVVNILLFVLSTRDEGIVTGLQDWSNYATALFWGIGIVAHAGGVFAPDIFFGKEWEEKKIREFMEKEKRNRWE